MITDYWPTCASCGVDAAGPESCHCTETCDHCGDEFWADEMIYIDWFAIPCWMCWDCAAEAA